MMQKRVLALQHIWDDPLGLLATFLDEYDIAYDIVNVEHATIPDPTAYDALIVLGGSQHVNDDEKYPYFIEEKRLICKAVERGIPYLGICLGGQLLAVALGATVKRHTMTEIGFFDIPLTEEGKTDPLYAGLPGFHKVFHWHEDTFDIPQDGVHLAANENTLYQAFRYGTCAYGLQYHIELNPAMLDTWLHQTGMKEDIIANIGVDAYLALNATLDQHYPTYVEHSRLLFANFLRLGGLIR